MKTAQNTTDHLLNQFDKELLALLKHDLKKFKSEKGKFLPNKNDKSQGNDLLVA
jgi:hypothetical protein